MQDPIGSFERHKRVLPQLLGHCFPHRRRTPGGRASQLLRNAGSLCTDPLVEPMPRYVNDSEAIDDWISDQSTVLEDLATRNDLQQLNLSCPDSSRRIRLTRVSRFKSRYRPYAHQVEMTRRGLREWIAWNCYDRYRLWKDRVLSIADSCAIGQRGSRLECASAEFLSRRWWHDPSTGRPWVNEKGKIAFTAIPGITAQAKAIRWQARLFRSAVARTGPPQFAH